MSNYYYYEPAKTIETDKGIKAKSKRGAFVTNWWATRWIEAMTNIVDRGRLQRGKRYARKGQVVALDEKKGGILAKVQGSRKTPYKVQISLTALNDAQWNKVLEALSQRAIFSAQLLAGEMPQEIEQVFADVGVPLFPMRWSDLQTSCSCPDYADVCKHLAATHYILGERFDEDPFLIFRLRGHNEQQIMDALRQSGAAAPEAGLEPAQPLTLDNFWHSAQPLTHFATHIKPPTTLMPILKRLGQPRFVSDNLENVLKDAYISVTEEVITLAFEDDKTA